MSSKLTVTFTMAILTLLLIVSCAPSKLTPATTSEPPIPSGYTHYTSEGLFSISYPPGWVTHILGAIDTHNQRSPTSTGQGIFVESRALVFSMGVLAVEGYYPNVAIAVDSPSGVIWTLDSLVEAIMQDMEVNVDDYHEFSRVKTTIDGREAVIIDLQINTPISGAFHDLYMITLVGKTAWLIGCRTSPEMFSDYEDDFHAVVRSFRISN